VEQTGATRTGAGRPVDRTGATRTGANRPVDRTGAGRPVDQTGATRTGTGRPLDRTGASRPVDQTGATRTGATRTGAARPVDQTGSTRTEGPRRNPRPGERTQPVAGSIGPPRRRTDSTSAVSATAGSQPAGPRDAEAAAVRRRSDKAAEGPLDSAVNATAARLVAEGRSRMADQGDAGQPERRRRDRRAQRFDPASLAALPAELKERVFAYYRRRSAVVAGYTPRQRLWRRARWIGLGALGLFIVLPVMMFVIGYLYFSIPSPDDAATKQIATIDYADGSSMASIVPPQGNRIKVNIDQIPKAVQYASLSAEDRTFFSNPGFDPLGLTRAVWKQLTGGVGGGSTITQQYVKKTLVGDEHSLWRKYKEMVLAVKISQQNSKDKILADYLNAIYFGRSAYGIQAASKAYFNKNVWELDAAQGALLAGVIQSPSRWDPAVNPQHAAERWSYVIDGMVEKGWLPAAQRTTAHFPATVPPQRTSGGTPLDYRGLILNAVRDELEQRLNISEQEFNQEGLKITTTIDPQAQQQAVDAAQKNMAGQPDNLRTALVSIDPTTGAVLAYYGGGNGVGLDYARVDKQPGSTFKPFVLLAALQQDDPIGLGSKFKGEPRPGLRNADGASCQLCDLKQAMTISNNVIYHDLAVKVGPDKVADAARQAGITSPLTNVDAGIALGDKEVTPVELASAYGTFAANGTYHPPHLVTKVTASDNRVLYDSVDDAGQQRIRPQVARNVVEAMLGVPGYDKLTLPGARAVAAKTGTVQSYLENQNNDAWTVGFTPQMVSAVWVGTDQNTPIKNSKGQPIYGAMLPGQIWRSYMQDAARSPNPQSFPPFKAIGTPPAVTGTNDGFMAGPSPSPAPAPSSSASASASPSPDGGNNTGNQGGQDRECGLLGCHDVPTDNNDDGSNSRSDNHDEAGNQPNSDTGTGLTSNAREPVRG
jgi:membrane peptidoglycan carboxypeptidase